MPSRSRYRYTLYESHISGTFLRLAASLIEEAVVVFEFNCGRSPNVVLTVLGLVFFGRYCRCAIGVIPCEAAMSVRVVGEACEAVMVEGTFVGSGVCLYSVTHHGFHGRPPHAGALTFVAGVVNVFEVEASVFIDVAVFEKPVVFGAFDSHDVWSLKGVLGVLYGHIV